MKHALMYNKPLKIKIYFLIIPLVFPPLKLTHNLLNVLNGKTHLTILELSIIILGISRWELDMVSQQYTA